jgi:hypothetical protein
MVSSLVFSTMLAPTADAKKPIFDLPPAEKIDVAPEAAAQAPAAAPPVELPAIKLQPQVKQAPIVQAAPVVAPASVAPSVHTQPELNVIPPATQAPVQDATAVNEDTTLQGNIDQDAFVPKGPMDGNNALLVPMSVKGSKKADSKSALGGNMVDQALKVNAAPLPLVDGGDTEKGDEKACIEKEQLTALWEATLTKSPDIQFVLQKLLPSSDPSRVTSVLMRTLSTVAMGGIGAVGAISPTPGTYMFQNVGYSALNQILAIGESKKAQKAKISQTEAIMLFDMIRRTADTLVDKFRSYKKTHVTLAQANNDFEDLKGMAQGAREGQDASKQLEIEYTLRRQQRDIDGIGQDLGKYRQGLVDLAGAEAVAKLDMSIDEEFQKLHPDLLAAPKAPITPDGQMQNKLAGREDVTSQAPQSNFTVGQGSVNIDGHTLSTDPAAILAAEQNNAPQVGARKSSGPITATHTMPERTPVASPLVAPTNGAVPN